MVLLRSLVIVKLHAAYAQAYVTNVEFDTGSKLPTVQLMQTNKHFVVRKIVASLLKLRP